ncbi:restriction endonuclease subunit S [Actinoplanes sp. NPDC049118]|uniref:restriction endonuclease subunit S n=1 Tax=Actinoplanes sp. NPDC049118 TaxID=3155769 RepID=UPI0033C01385
MTVAAPGSWSRSTLGELCAAGGGDIQTGPFGSQLHARDYVENGIPSVMPQNIGDNVIDTDGIARIAPADARRLSRYLLAEGDIVYSRRGDIERRALIGAEQAGWLCGTGCLRIRPGDAVHSGYLSYYLGHPEVRRWIVRHAVGATMLNLNSRILGEVPVVLPPRATQEAVAGVLGALDDRIAVGARIADTSRRLNAAVFAAAARESGEERTIGDIAGFLSRGQTPRYTPDSSGMLAVNQRCVRGGRVSRDPARRTEAGRVREDRILRRDDVLVNSTGVGTLGRVGIWSHDDAATVDSHVTIVRIGAGIPAIVGAFAVLAAQERIASLGEGSTGQTELSRAKLASVVVRIPGGGIDALAARLSAVEERADAALAESRMLAGLRDTLLPALLSGRLRAGDAAQAPSPTA